MVNRSKQKGTRAESGVVNYARTFGYPWADRQPLRGSLDQGDVLLCPGLVAEVKAGKAAWDASDNQIAAWLDETLREKKNAKADYALLVVARYRQPVERWWAVLPSHDLAVLNTHEGVPYGPDMIARLSLKAALTLLRHFGYGDALPTVAEMAS
jgi:hypothetical protein